MGGKAAPLMMLLIFVQDLVTEKFGEKSPRQGSASSSH